MAGIVDGVLDADQWAFRPAELARIVLDQLEGGSADGLTAWIEARWLGPVLLDGDAMEAWIRDWESRPGRNEPPVARLSNRTHAPTV